MPRTADGKSMNNDLSIQPKEYVTLRGRLAEANDSAKLHIADEVWTMTTTFMSIGMASKFLDMMQNSEADLSF